MSRISSTCGDLSSGWQCRWHVRIRHQQRGNVTSWPGPPVTHKSDVGVSCENAASDSSYGHRLPPQVLTTEVGDWRKNVEAMSGMEGRKKMFDAAGGGQ